MVASFSTVLDSRALSNNNDVYVSLAWCTPYEVGYFGCEIAVKESVNEVYDDDWSNSPMNNAHWFSSQCTVLDDDLSCRVSDTRMNYEATCSIEALGNGGSAYDACTCKTATVNTWNTGCAKKKCAGMTVIEDCNVCATQKTSKCSFKKTKGSIEYSGIPWFDGVLDFAQGNNHDDQYEEDDADYQVTDMVYESQPSIQAMDLGKNIKVKSGGAGKVVRLGFLTAIVAAGVYMYKKRRHDRSSDETTASSYALDSN